MGNIGIVGAVCGFLLSFLVTIYALMNFELVIIYPLVIKPYLAIIAIFVQDEKQKLLLGVF